MSKIQSLRSIFVNVNEVSSIHHSPEASDTIILSMRNGDIFHLHAENIMDVVNEIKKVRQTKTSMLADFDLSKLELR